TRDTSRLWLSNFVQLAVEFAGPSVIGVTLEVDEEAREILGELSRASVGLPTEALQCSLDRCAGIVGKNAAELHPYDGVAMHRKRLQFAHGSGVRQAELDELCHCRLITFESAALVTALDAGARRQTPCLHRGDNPWDSRLEVAG